MFEATATSGLVGDQIDGHKLRRARDALYAVENIIQARYYIAYRLAEYRGVCWR